MTPDSKKRRIDDQNIEEKDRISNLPSHLISCILDCMVIKDAARTCTLSKTWNDVWEAHPNIVLSSPIVNQLISKNTIVHTNTDSQSPLYQQTAAKNRAICYSRFRRFVDVVQSILLAQKGPILKFILHIPPDIYLHKTSYPILWMIHVLITGVRVLDFSNATESPTYDMPYDFYLCSELSSLTLNNWKLSPPPKFEGFHKLTSLHLSYVTITAEMSFGAQVQNFSLHYCAGIEHLDRQLTSHNKNINTLSIARSVEMEKLYALGRGYNPFTCTKKSFNLRRILGNMNSVENLTLDTVCLMHLDPSRTIHNQLTTTMKNLKTLMLVDVAFDCLLHISNSFCLLRSMPNLKVLKITLVPDSEDMKIINVTSEQYLESQNITLSKLQTVEVQGMVGSKAELLFIKLLLGSSSSLTRMKLGRKITISDPNEELRIAREVLQFPRKSRVEIFWI